MKMRTMLLALLASIGMLASAFAGDINNPTSAYAMKAPVYVPPAAPCNAAACTGAYLGAELAGSGSGVNVLNLGELNAGGTSMGVNGGYQFWNGTYWLGVKAKVDYQVAQPANSIVGASFSNKIFAFEGAEMGANVAQVLGTVAPITLNGILQNAVPTVLIGACQNGSALKGYCVGAGAHFFIPNSRWTIDADYLNAQYGATMTAPGQTVTTENRGSFGFSYHFGM